MATVTELARRVLGKLKVLDAVETPAAADLAKAEEKVRAAHALLKAEGLLRWTLADIPDYAEEPYVLLGAFLAADDFATLKEPDWLVIGMRQIQRGVHVAIVDDSTAENF